MSTLAFLSLPAGSAASSWARSPIGDGSGAASVAGVTDRSLMPKLQVTAAPRAGSLGTAIHDDDGAWWCPVTPSRSLVLGGVGWSPALPAGAVDLTCAYAAVELSGARSADVLARFCALDVRPQKMPVGAFRPGSVARTPGYVLRSAPDTLLLLVGWALGEYLWTVATDAAGRLHA